MEQIFLSIHILIITIILTIFIILICVLYKFGMLKSIYLKLKEFYYTNIYNAKEIVSLDISCNIKNWRDYVNESDIKMIISILYNTCEIYPPKAKIVKTKKPVVVYNYTWNLDEEELKMIKDYVQTTQEYATEKRKSVIEYLDYCLHIILENLINYRLKKNCQSIK